MEKTISVKNIAFKATFNGNGCVNFDSGDQKFELCRFDILKGKVYDNVLYAKKVYYKQDDGTTTFRYKVSSEALRHAIFSEEMPFMNPTIQQLPQVFYNSLGTPAMLARGYMFAGDVSLKRKSPLTITDAVETGKERSLISIDFHSRSGAKNTDTKGAEDKKDTTIYNIENVGNNQYVAYGNIDLQELQFVSADPSYDRMAVDIDGGVNETIYLDSLNRNLPTQDKRFGYYFIKNAITEDEWAERGVLLSNDDVDFLVKYILKNILSVNICRRNALLSIEKLEVTFDNGNSYQELRLDNLNDYYFEVVSKYQEASEEKILKNRQKIDEIKTIKKSNKGNKNSEE